MGLDREQIAYVKKQNSRWCTIFKNYPQCCVVEREIGLVNLYDDDSSGDEKLAKARRKSRQQQEEEEEKSSPALV